MREIQKEFTITKWITTGPAWFKNPELTDLQDLINKESDDAKKRRLITRRTNLSRRLIKKKSRKS